MELNFLEVGLDAKTAALATGHEAVCIFVNDIADAEVGKTTPSLVHQGRTDML